MATRRKTLPQYLTLGKEGEEIYTPIIQAAAEVKNTAPSYTGTIREPGDIGVNYQGAPQPETPAAADTYTYRQTAPDYSKYAAPAYSGSKWDDDYKAAVQAALGMNYTDWTQGTDYASLAARYANQGQRAMTNTLGEYAARTGGVASSYAVSAAQQQYNQYMQQLEEVARQMYENERSQRYNDAALLQSLSEADYDRHKDNYDRLAWDYQLAQDQYSTDRAAESDAQNRVQQFFASGGKLDTLPKSLRAASGYSDKELEAMQSYYATGALGDLTEEDAAQLAALFGSGATNWTPESWDLAVGMMGNLSGREDGEVEDWLLENNIYRDPGVMANEDYADAYAQLKGTGKEGSLMTLAQWQNSPMATQFASYAEYIEAYLEWAKEN